MLSVPKKRRRSSNLSTDDQADPVIGHVTLSGKFKCLSTNCDDVSFGRQADFRRHYEHNHVAQRVEYYCIVDGCQRSRKPFGKSKGRGFGAREDKMKEHVRTVHGQGKKNNKISTHDISGKVDQFDAEDEEAQEGGQAKQKSSCSAYEDYSTWTGGMSYI